MERKWNAIFWVSVLALIFGSCTVNDALTRKYGNERFLACVAAVKDVTACEKVR